MSRTRALTLLFAILSAHPVQASSAEDSQISQPVAPSTLTHDTPLGRYVRAVEFAGRSTRLDHLSPAETHAEALAILARRPTDEDLEFELERFTTERLFLNAIPNFDPREVDRFARELAARADPWTHYNNPERELRWHEWFTATFPRVHRHFVDARVPLSATWAALDIMVRMDTTELLKTQTHWRYFAPTYARALDFALGRAPRGGGLDPWAAHGYAAGRHAWNSEWVRMQVESFQAAYKKLTDGTDARGRPLPSNQAQARAWALATEPGHAPVVEDILDHLERERVVPSFVTTPIRKGGLGQHPPESDRTIARLCARELCGPRIGTYIATYQNYLARILARQFITKSGDELGAREQALAWLALDVRVDEVTRELDEGHYPRVTLAELPAWMETDHRAHRWPKVSAIVDRVTACAREIMAKQ